MCPPWQSMGAYALLLSTSTKDSPAKGSVGNLPSPPLWFWGLHPTSVERAECNVGECNSWKYYDGGLTAILQHDTLFLVEPGTFFFLQTHQTCSHVMFSFSSTDKALVRLKKPNNICSLLKKSSALLVKRFHHTRRNVKGFIAQVILPVLFVTTAMGLGTLRTEVAEYPALQLSPSLYGSSKLAEFFG